jgi:hypothetical protein
MGATVWPTRRGHSQQSMFHRHSKLHCLDRNQPRTRFGTDKRASIQDLCLQPSGLLVTNPVDFLEARFRITSESLTIRQTGLNEKRRPLGMGHPLYLYSMDTAKVRWIAFGGCPNALRNDRRIRSRFPKPFFLAISSAEKRLVSIKRANSTRNRSIA